MTDRRIGAGRGNATLTSNARAVVWGTTVLFLVPASEINPLEAGSRFATTFTDRNFTFATATTAVDVTPGGPGDWDLQPIQLEPVR